MKGHEWDARAGQEPEGRKGVEPGEEGKAMKTGEVKGRKGRVPVCADSRSPGFMTREERSAREHNNPLAYFRLEDSLCHSYLRLATDEREFEGLKLLFPFVRELSVLRVSRGMHAVSWWMQLAFVAGHDLGRAHPARLEDVLPGMEVKEATNRVSIIRRCSGKETFTHEGLKAACENILTEKWGGAPKEAAEAFLVEATVKSLRAGFAAATVCQSDPVVCEFVWDMPHRVGNDIGNIMVEAAVGAPLNAVGKPVAALLEHPLLRMTRELYPNHPTERDAVLGFVRHQLRALKVKSENECPCSELDLADWIKAGIEYGRQFKREHPDIVERVFAEASGKRLEESIHVVQRVVAEAAGTDPVRLLGRLKCWVEDTHGLAKPKFYGEELARAAYFADFAVWIPWVVSAEVVFRSN